MPLRLLTAMVTPFTSGLDLDLATAGSLARRLAAEGSDGLVVAGTTGESPTLSADEKERLLDVVLAAVGDRTETWANTGTYDTRASIQCTRAAERAGAHGVMLVVPYYSRPGQEGLYGHFRAIAEQTHLPVLLYNVPSRTAQNLLPETVLRLMEDCPNVAGIKEASGDLAQVGAILRSRRPGFLVLSGDDKLALPVVALGGDGVISVAAHLVGPDMRRMLDCFAQGRPAEAAQMHLHLLPLFAGLFMVSNPVPVKEALSLVGQGAGSVRPPLAALGDGERAVLRQTLEAVGLLRTGAGQAFAAELPREAAGG